MPTFATPEPITVAITIAAGEIHIAAGDRTDTVVEVRPHSGSSADTNAAEQTRIDYANGELQIRGPQQQGWLGRGGSVDVTVALPAGSRLHCETASADLTTAGRLGDCRVTTASGDIRLDETGALKVDSASGDIGVTRVQGDMQATTASGDIRVDAIDGAAVLRSASGDSRVGEVTGELRLTAANGDISVGRTGAGVTARTASGDVRIAEVVRGSVLLDTASGDLEIGIRAGTAAWLDVNSLSGSVRSGLDTADGPAQSDETAEVRARAVSGDILIRRS